LGGRKACGVPGGGMGGGRDGAGVGRTATALLAVATSVALLPLTAPRRAARRYLNVLFVVARSIGLIGHALDQKRLQQPLYRHPWEDVLYTT
jgi:hypothetical protein